MTVTELLATLDQRGMELWFEGNQLRFRAPKGALSEELRAELAQNKNAVLEVLRQRAHESELTHPLSHNQQALWFLKEAYPENPAYNVAFAAQFCSAIDLPALRNACQALVDRHPMLRTTYVSDKGVPTQKVHGYQDVCFEVIDASSWDGEKLREQVVRAHKSPFDLEHGPLFRVHLFTRSSTDHVFLLAAHHVAMDGWSTWLIIDELRRIYSALSKGMTIPLLRPKNHYLDYVSWQSNLLNGPEGERLWDFWRQQLDGKLSTLDLPYDRPRSSMRIGYGASHTFSLSEELTQRIKDLAKAESVTLYMLLLAAYQTLLYRYTGQENILVGSPMSGRSRPEFAGLVGCFVNSVVLSADFAENIPFRKLLNRTRQTVLDALNNQDYPLRLLTQQLRPKQGIAGSPIFQVDFVLQKPQQFGELSSLFSVSASADARIDFGGIEIQQFYLPQQEGQLDLTLEMMEGNHSLVGILKFNTDLFDVSTISQMVSHFQNLLEGIVSDPDQLITQIPILGAEERQQLLSEWNDNTLSSPQLQQCIHQLAESQAAATPDAIAVVVPANEQNPQRQTLTYQELNQRANQLAHYLIKAGVGPERIVGICVNRSLEMIVGVLGVLKAGGAYLPLDPLYPQERLNYSLADSGADILLTQQALANTFDGAGLQVINLDANWPLIAEEGNTNPPCRVASDNLVYVTYTSGSTGQSKGVMVEHRNLVNAYLAWEKDYQLKSLTSHLQMANFPFDVFSGDLVRALCSGGKLVICPRELLLAPQKLYQLICEEKIDCAEFVPAVLRQLVKHLLEAQQTLDFVQLLICGSDSWYVAEYEEFLSVCGEETRLINSFGLTEATIDSTYFEGPVAEMSGDRLVPIGKPFANTRLYILDQHLQPMPIGVPGELYIGGRGVARGYLNRPELTGQKFINDPFQAQEGDRLYKTGDKARFLSDGNVEFLGRMDNQVKIRGFRVELGEVEAVLGKHPEVAEAVVVVHQGQSTEKQLVAYVVAKETSPSPQDLRGFLQKQLPDYMIPNYFVTLEALPLSANGKIDRKALPEPDANASAIYNTFIAPKTPLQELVAGVWADILGLQQVGIEDNFFELGGHSLLATQVMSRIQRLIQAELPLRILFESPTVASLTGRIEALQGNLSGSIVPIRAYERQGHLPLSYSQERLWFLDQMEPGNFAYNLPGAIRLKGELHLSCLQQALDEILARHEVLRTNFDIVDDQPVQIIHPVRALPLNFIDLSRLSGEDQLTEARRITEQEVKRPFDLRHDLLIRASLLRLNEADHVFVLNMHHIVSDGWSITVFAREFTTLYSAFVNGQPNPFPPLPIQYADFAQWQREWLRGERLESQLNYWKQQLGGELPQLELLLDKPRPALQTHQSGRAILELSTSLSQELKKLSQQEDATLFMTLLAAFKLLLHRQTGIEDIIVGSPIAGRNQTETENLIGFFLNTLALRTDLAGNPSFRALIQRVKKVAMDAYTHQDVPFEKLLIELHPERNLSRTPLFQVFFNMLNLGSGTAQQLQGLTAESFENPEIGAKFDITLYVADKGDALSLNLVYNADLFMPERIESLLSEYDYLLSQIVTDPGRGLQDYSLTTPDAKTVLPDSGLPLSSTWYGAVHAKFCENATRCPNYVALIDKNAQWSYEELDQLSSRLANYLIKNEIQPGDVIAIYADRSASLVVALLGILKAGAAFVLLDPAYPSQRLIEYLQLAEPRAWVQLESAGVAPAALQEFMADSLFDCKLTLPATPSQAVALLQEFSIEMPSVNIEPDDLAYIAFTSGSTGRPKGILGSHQPLSHFIQWHSQTFDLKQADRFSMLSGLAHDPLLRDIFTPLSLGAALSIPDQEQLLSPGELLGWMQQQHITVAHLTPSLQQVLVTSADNLPVELSDLRYAFFGGEPLTRQHVLRLKEFAPNVVCVNFYGATETPQAMSYSIVEITQLKEITPLGRGIQDVQLLVLNTTRQLAGTGEVGEIYIRTPYLSKGYLKDDTLTHERFLINPFTNDSADRMYKTGDRGRYLPNGEVEFLGRSDDQVKIRGFRIELGEIEAALQALPKVKQAVVSIWGAGADEKRLVAYIVPDTSPSPHAHELMGYLQQQLPSYMIPASFITLDSIPLTPNGKVDRSALPQPDFDSKLHDTFIVPQTENEKIIAEIWEDVLKLNRVGLHDNFFELGGHSLLATQVVSRLRKVFQIDIPLRDLFMAPTVAKSAELIETMIWATQGQSASSKIAVGEGEELEL